MKQAGLAQCRANVNQRVKDYTVMFILKINDTYIVFFCSLCNNSVISE